MMKRLLGAVALVSVMAPCALAQGADAGCEAYASFDQPVAQREAAAGQYNWQVAQILLNRVSAITLQPIDAVQFVAAPERAPGEGVFAGMISFVTPVAGTYRVALSEDVPVDLLNSDGESYPPLDSPGVSGCAGVGKVLAFDLQPGAYILQFTEKAESGLTLMVSRAE